MIFLILLSLIYVIYLLFHNIWLFGTDISKVHKQESWSGIIAHEVLIRMALSKGDISQNNTDIKSTTQLYDQWKVLQCWPWMGHLPSFFISAARHGSSSVPAPGNLPSTAKECPCHAQGFTGWGGMLGGVGSPKIDWCIIVALLLIQALVEDKQLRSLITRTKSLSSQPNHSSFIFSTCLLHSRGEKAEPFFVWFFFSFEGFSLSKNYCFFFLMWSLSHMHITFCSCWLLQLLS